MLPPCSGLGLTLKPKSHKEPRADPLIWVLLLQLVKFIGCYHGHADSFLVQAGSGVATLGLPDSPGVPASSTGERERGIKL